MTQKKALEGLQSNPQLITSLQEILALPQPNEENHRNDDASSAIEQEDNLSELRQALSPSSSTHSPTTSASMQRLESILRDQQQKDSSSSSSPSCIPLKAITAAKHLLETTTASSELKTHHETQLNESLSHPSTQLVFTQPDTDTPKERTKEQIAFQKRLERLRLVQQERAYEGLTQNIDKNIQDDNALSGMMYATSVGANMIVAPITFGVFMYFFGAKFFSWMESEGSTTTRKEGQLDIRGVIMGVISGVIMLFIEMILFVIRNHEMDKYMTKKKKTDRTNAFGYNARRAERTFMG